MIFAQNKLIFFLKRNNIQVYSKDSDSPLGELDIPANIESDEEIKDVAAYEKLVSDFLSKLDARGKKSIIALSEEITFQKTFTESDETKLAALVQKFFDSVPFNPNQLAKKIIKSESGTQAVAANRQLYAPLVSLVAGIDLKVEAVVPLASLGITQSQALTTDDITKILASTKLVHQNNLLEQTGIDLKSATSTDKTPEPKPKSSASPQTSQKDSAVQKKKLLQIAAVAIFIIFALTLLSVALKPLIFRNKPQTVVKNVQQVEEATSQPSLLQEATQSPTLDSTASPQLDTNHNQP